MANLGITLPLERGNNGYFAQGRDILSQAKSNLTNLILTKKGERILQPDFGCDIHRIIFEPITDDNVANIRGTIEGAVKLWLPYINIEDVQIQRDENRNSIFTTITFSINTSVTITDSITLVF
jgi:phage baseplate assembly protein W